MLGVLTIKIDQLRADAQRSRRASASARGTASGHQRDHRRCAPPLASSAFVDARLSRTRAGAAEARRGILRRAMTSRSTLRMRRCRRPLPSEVALCLFRVAEESLTNIAKHSQARSAHGAGDRRAGRHPPHRRGCRQRLRHDQRSSSKAGLGFVSMQERLRVLHGTIHVDSAPSRGTRIDAWVPPTMLTAPRRGSASIGDRVSRPRDRRIPERVA